MRTAAFKVLVDQEQDELASDAFDRLADDAQQWIERKADDDDYSTCDRDAVYAVVYAAVEAYYRPAEPERVAKLLKAVAHLRDRYVDWSGRVGTYAEEAGENVAANLQEKAEADAEWRAEMRAEEAREAGLRG